MVRIIVGTLLRVGRGFYTPEQVKEILEAKNRKSAGVTAPPHGLMLMEIEYKDSEVPVNPFAKSKEESVSDAK